MDLQTGLNHGLRHMWCYSKLSHHLRYWHSIPECQFKSQLLLFLSSFPLMHPGKNQLSVQVFGFLLPCGRPRCSGTLVLSWFIPGDVGHLDAKSACARSFSCLLLFSVTLHFKQMKTSNIIKCTNSLDVYVCSSNR